MHALAPLLGEQELDVAAAVRLNAEASVIRQADGTGKAVVGYGDFQHLTLGGAFHAGAVKQLDQNLVLRHSTVQRAPGDENIAGAVVAAGKAEAGCQLDQRAGNGVGRGFVAEGGKAGGVLPVFDGQFAGGDHGGHGGAQAGIVHLQVILQLAQRHGAALDRI